MNAVASTSRSPSARFSIMTEDYSYGAAARSGHHHGHGWRIFSTRRSGQNLMTSWSYRRDRARKRQIFLQTYKLGYATPGEKLLRSRKLKKMVVKVKSAVVSVLAFMRGGALKSCNSRSSIPAASPARVSKLC